jgi:hypothetical protein
VSARVAPGSFRLLSGEGSLAAWRPPDGFEKFFCRECGGALWSQDPADPEVKSVRMGAFDEDPGVRPSWRAYVDFAVPWEPIPDDGLPRFGGARPPS